MANTPGDFRAWAGHWASGVGVVVAGAGEEMRAATITAFVPVSFEPPLIAICLSRSGRMSELLRGVARWSVSALGADDYRLARHFAHPARLTGSAELQRVGIVDAGEGVVALEGASAWLVCARESMLDLGDHSMFVGRVTQYARDPEKAPLIVWRGALRRLGEAAAPASWTALAADDLNADW